MRILVCGGAGYIGSHMVKQLCSAGHEIVVFDNLSTGHRDAVLWGELVEGDVRDGLALRQVFAQRRFDAVMHFCARSLVAESVRLPLTYYDNNVLGTLRLLEVMAEHSVDRLVFSSTAAVYGEPMQDLIDEEHATRPVNPYGASKVSAERMIKDACHASGLRAVALRYFNAAGADPSGIIGESHDPETHLIPNAVRALLGASPALRVFGKDYPTPDGTCVRDYVHVVDIVQAHLLALNFMEGRSGFHVFNLGSGRGYSVQEILQAIARVAGRAVPHEVAPRRPGDPARLVASNLRARESLGWAPRSDLDQIVTTALAWHERPRY